MCNTWRNIFLQSMKNNTLSVKKLTKNLILRTLRQLYAVSEIIILIRWVTPPQKSWKSSIWVFHQFLKFLSCSFSSTLHRLHLFRHFSSLAKFIYEFMSSTTFTYSYFFKSFSAKWMWSDPSPSMLYTNQSIHKFFMCVLFETRSKSSLCPCQLKKLWTEL